MEIAGIVKRAGKTLFKLAGLDIRRANPPWRREDAFARECATCMRATLGGALGLAARNGLRPFTVIDCGAAFGTAELYLNFPDARHVFIEPLREYQEALKSLKHRLKSADIVQAAAAANEGVLTINVHPDLVGSSTYLEEEDSDVNGVPREVPAVTLDNVCRRLGTQGPYLIKLDVQGSELDVLNGAADVLLVAELVVMETSLFEFYKGAPQLGEVIAFMKTRGFVPYDVVGAQYRLMDGAMSQIDVVFVRESGVLRVHHVYATPEQRRQQTAALRANVGDSCRRGD